jgi:hypothetical protein
MINTSFTDYCGYVNPLSDESEEAKEFFWQVDRFMEVANELEKDSSLTHVLTALLYAAARIDAYRRVAGSNPLTDLERKQEVLCEDALEVFAKLLKENHPKFTGLTIEQTAAQFINEVLLRILPEEKRDQDLTLT